MGFILIDMPKNKGGGDGSNQHQKSYLSTDTTSSKSLKLKDIGISRDQSSAYQAVASIPEPEFEQQLADFS